MLYNWSSTDSHEISSFFSLLYERSLDFCLNRCYLLYHPSNTHEEAAVSLELWGSSMGRGLLASWQTVKQIWWSSHMRKLIDHVLIAASLIQYPHIYTFFQPGWEFVWIWSNLFNLFLSRWVAVDVGRNLFDFAEFERRRVSGPVGISGRILADSESSTLKMVQGVRTEETRPRESSESSKWFGSEEEGFHQFDEISQPLSSQSVVELSQSDSQFATDENKRTSKFGNLLLTGSKSDNESDSSDSEIEEMDSQSSSKKTTTIAKSSEILRPTKRRKIDEFCYTFDSSPCPETNLDLEVDRVALADAITSAWSSRPRPLGRRQPSEPACRVVSPVKSEPPSKFESPFILAVNRGGILRDVTRRYRERYECQSLILNIGKISVFDNLADRSAFWYFLFQILWSFDISRTPSRISNVNFDSTQNIWTANPSCFCFGRCTWWVRSSGKSYYLSILPFA